MSTAPSETTGALYFVCQSTAGGGGSDRQYIARLVGKVTQVSVETVRLVRELAAKVDLLVAVGVSAVV